MRGGFIPNLSEAHRSRIRITLTLLNEALIKCEEWAQGREVRSILYREENTLHHETRAALLTYIGCIRRIVTELRDDLHLEARAQDIAKTIRGHCSILWVDVLEMTGKYLRGFGEPQPELVHYLDPKAHQILRYLHPIKRLLSTPAL